MNNNKTVNILKSRGLSTAISDIFLDPTKVYNVDMYTHANFVLPSLKEPLNRFIDDLINDSDMDKDDVLDELRSKMRIIFNTYSHGKLRKTSAILKWFKKNYDDRLSSILSSFNYTTNNHIKSASNSISIKYDKEAEEIIVNILTVSVFDIRLDTEMKITKSGVDFTLRKSDYAWGNIESEEEPLHGHYKTIEEIFTDNKFKEVSKHVSLYNAIFATIIDLKLILNLTYHIFDRIVNDPMFGGEDIEIFTKLVIVKSELLKVVLNFTLDERYNMIDRVNNYEDYRFQDLSEINLDDNIESLDEFMNYRFSDNELALAEMTNRDSAMYLSNLTLNTALKYISIRSVFDTIGLKYVDLFNLIDNTYESISHYGANNMTFDTPIGSKANITVNKPDDSKSEFVVRVEIDGNIREFILNKDMDGKLPNETKFYIKKDCVLFNTERASLEVERENKDTVELLLFYTICILKLFNSKLYLDNNLSDSTIYGYLKGIKEKLFSEHIQSNVLESISMSQIRDMVNTSIINDINKISDKIKEDIGDINLADMRELIEQLGSLNDDDYDHDEEEDNDYDE